MASSGRRVPKLALALEHEKCRTFGHAWESFIPLADGKRPAPWGKRFSLRCVRCYTERHDTWDALGQLSTRHYDYPPDYKLGKDETPNIAQLRLHLAKRLHEEGEA